MRVLCCGFRAGKLSRLEVIAMLLIWFDVETHDLHMLVVAMESKE